MGFDELLGRHREAILALAAKHGARNVRVFGSMARGDARPDSDLDLLVEFGPGVSLMDVVRVERELSELVGRRVDLATPGELKHRIRDGVLREARSL